MIEKNKNIYIPSNSKKWNVKFLVVEILKIGSKYRWNDRREWKEGRKRYGVL